eukprot:gene4404-3204_t
MRSALVPLMLAYLVLAVLLASDRHYVAGNFLDDLDDWEMEDPVNNAASCVGGDTTILASANTYFLNRLVSALSPRFDSQLQNYTIPPQVIPHGTTGEIYIEHFYVDGLALKFGEPEPAQFTIQIFDLSFAIDDSNFTVTSGITCNGIFWGEFQHTDVNISMRTFVNEDHEFVSEVTNASFRWGDIQLHHKVIGSMCNMAESVVSVFLGDLDELVEKRVKEEIPKQLPVVLDEQIKLLLSTLPFPVSGGPYIEDDVVTFEMQLIRPEYLSQPSYINSHMIHLNKAKELARKHDVALVVPQKSIQNRLDYTFCRQKLGMRSKLPSQWNSELFRNVFPEMYHMCSHCLLEVEIESERTWKIDFNQETIDLTIPGLRLGIFMVTETSQQARKIHEYIMSGEDELPKGRAWLTPDFTAATPMDANTKIPIGQVRISGRIEASEVYLLSVMETKLYYTLEIVDDMDVQVLEMNVNGLDERDIRRAVMGAMNFGVVIRLNQMQPIALPSFLTEAESTFNQDFITVFSNIKLSKLLEYIDNMTKPEDAEAEQDKEIIPSGSSSHAFFSRLDLPRISAEHRTDDQERSSVSNNTEIDIFDLLCILCLLFFFFISLITRADIFFYTFNSYITIIIVIIIIIVAAMIRVASQVRVESAEKDSTRSDENLTRSPTSPLLSSGRNLNDVYSSLTMEFKTIFSNLWKVPLNKPLQVEQCCNALVDTLYFHATEIATNEIVQHMLLHLVEQTFKESIDLGCLAFDAISDLTWKNPYEKRYQSLNILYNQAVKLNSKQEFLKLSKLMMSMMHDHPVSTSDFVNDHMRDLLGNLNHEDLHRRAVSCEILSFIIGTQIIKFNPALLDLVTPACSHTELLQCALQTQNEWYRASILRLLTSMVEEYTYELSSQIASSIATQVNDYLENMTEESQIAGMLSIISSLATSPTFGNAPWNLHAICSFLTDRDWSVYSNETFLSAGFTVIRAVYYLFYSIEELYIKGVTCMYGFLQSAEVELATKTLEMLHKLIVTRGCVRDPEGLVKSLLSCLHRLPYIPFIFELLEVIRSMYGDEMMAPIYKLLDEYMSMQQRDVNFGKLNSLLKFMGPRAPLQRDYFTHLVVDLSMDSQIPVLIRSLPLLITLEKTNQLDEAVNLMFHDDLTVRGTALNVVGDLCDIIIRRDESFSPSTAGPYMAAASVAAARLNSDVSKAVGHILDVAVADRDAPMRLKALQRLQPPLYPYLCEQNNLDALFVAMNDAHDNISDEALKLLCVLLHCNTDSIHPHLLRLQEYLLQDLTAADVSLTFNLKKIHILTVCADQYCLLLKSESVENVVIHILSEQTFLSERFAIALLVLVQSILEHAGPYHHCEPNLFYSPLLAIAMRREASPSLRRAALETLGSALTTLGVADNTTFFEVYRSLMRIIRRGAEEPRAVKVSAVKAISTIGAVNPVKVRKLLASLNAEDNGKMAETQSNALSRVHQRSRIHNRMEDKYPSILVYFIVRSLNEFTVDQRHQIEVISTLYQTILEITSSQRAAILYQILPDLQGWLADNTKAAVHDTVLRIMIELAVLQRQFRDVIPFAALKDLLHAAQKFCALPQASQPPTYIYVIQLLDELAKSVPSKEMRMHRWSLEFIHQRLSQNKSDGALMKKVVVALESFLVVVHERDLKLILPHVLQCMETGSQTPIDDKVERDEITLAAFHFLHCIIVRHTATVKEVFSQIALKLINFIDESTDSFQIDLGLRTLAHLFNLCRVQSKRFSVAMRKLSAAKKLSENFFTDLMAQCTELKVETRSTSTSYWNRSQPFKLTCARMWTSKEEFNADFSRCLRMPGPVIEVLRYVAGATHSAIIFSFLPQKKYVADGYKVFCIKARDPKSTLSQVLKIVRVEQSMEPPKPSDDSIIDSIALVPSEKNRGREQSWITWFHSSCVLLVKHSPYSLIAKSESMTNRNIEYARNLFIFASIAYMQHLSPENVERMMSIYTRVVEIAPQSVQQLLFSLAVFTESQRDKVGPLQFVNEQRTFTITRHNPEEKFGINYDEDPKRGVVVTKVAPNGLGGQAGVPVGAYLYGVNGTRIYHVSDIRNIIEGLTTIHLVFYQVMERRTVTNPRSLMDLNVLAKVSYESQRHSKSIYFNEILFEKLFRQMADNNDAECAEAREVLSVAERLFEFYSHLNFSAAAQGLAKVIARKFSSSVLQPDRFSTNEVSILEQLHWLNQALHTYRERMISPTGSLHLPAFIAVLRCQESVGNINLNVQLIKSHWDTLQESEKKLVAPYRARAAFWLGAWDEFDAVAAQPGLFEHLSDVERCAYMFRREQYSKLLTFTADTRASKTPLFSQCLNESYGRACDTLVTLRHLRHFEELVSYTTSGPQRKEMLRRFWNKRLMQLVHRPGDIFTLLSINSLVLKPKEDYHSYVLASQALTKVHWYDVASILHKRLLGESIDRNSLVVQKADFIHAYLKNIYATRSHQEAFDILNDVLSAWMIGLHSDRGEEAILEVQKATELSPNSYAAFHSLGILHYDLSRDSELPDEECVRHHVASISALFRSVQLCSDNINIALQDVLRILAIWFSNVDVDEVNEAVHSGMEQLQDHVWLSVIPQLIARISVNSKLSRTILAHLLIRVGTAYPQALIYPLTVAEKSPDIIRRAMAKRVLNGIRGTNENLVTQASLISNELVRIAILSAERWHAAIQSAATTPDDRAALLKSLDPIYREMENMETPNELDFKTKFGPSIDRAMYSLRSGDLGPRGRYSNRSTHISPTLATIKDTSVAVPGTFEHEKPLIYIQEFHSKVYVMPSKQRPRRVGLDASNGRRYLFLLKGHEDMRQDERVMQFIGLIDAIFMMENSTNSLGLMIPMYAVVPLSENVGVVGWVENTDTIYKMLETNRKENGISIYEEVEMIMKRGNVRTVEDYHKLPKVLRIALLRHAMDNSPDDEFRRIIWDRNASCEDWLSYRNNYGLTLAAMSMVGYVLGLGDRHLNNLMLQENGLVVHIDFGDCFEVAMHRAHFAEAVPFRLTRLLVKALGVTGVDGVYRLTSEVVMKNLRKHSENLLSILEAFIYDPLINWRLTANPAESLSQAEVASGNPDATAVLREERAKTTDMAMSKSVMKAQQLLVGGYTYAMELNTEETRNEQGDLAWARVRAKLTGQDFAETNNSFFSVPFRSRQEEESKLWSSWGSANSDMPFDQSSKNAVGAPLPTTYLSTRASGFLGRETLDVNKQVDRLIHEATSLDNLAEAFLTGWAPFW